MNKMQLCIVVIVALCIYVVQRMGSGPAWRDHVENLMWSASMAPKECFGYIDKQRQEMSIILVSEEKQREYVYTYEVSSRKLSVVMDFLISDDVEQIVMIDDSGDSSIEHSTYGISRRLINGEYLAAIRSLEDAVRSCPRPAAVWRA